MKFKERRENRRGNEVQGKDRIKTECNLRKGEKGHKRLKCKEWREKDERIKCKQRRDRRQKEM